MASYSDLVRNHLGLGSDRIIVSGMAVGHSDHTSHLSTFVSERAGLEVFTQWYDWNSADDNGQDWEVMAPVKATSRQS